MDLDKCTACNACAMACMDQNDIDVEQGERPFRKTAVVEQLREVAGCGLFDPNKLKLNYLSTACMHCDNAPCVTACPTGCMYKDEDTGLTLMDYDKCIGCRSCATACPFGAPTFGVDGKVQKCDGCIERIKAGMIPACVRVCPSGALSVHVGVDAPPVGRSLYAMAKKILEK